MANPAFYWYPDASGSLETVTLAKSLSDLHESTGRARVTSYAGDGSARTATWNGTRSVRIVLERGLSAANVRNLLAMENHMQRGGLVGFARDPAKLYCAYAGGRVLRGDTIFYGAGNLFATWNAGTLASGDEVVMESANPSWRSEANTISSVSGTQITLAAGIIYPAGVEVMLRHRDFYPALRMADDQVGRPMLTTEHRIAWTLDVTLDVCPEIITAGVDGVYGDALVSFGLASTTSPSRSGALSLDALLGATSPGDAAGGTVSTRTYKIVHGGPR